MLSYTRPFCDYYVHDNICSSSGVATLGLGGLFVWKERKDLTNDDLQLGDNLNWVSISLKAVPNLQECAELIGLDLCTFNFMG